MELIMNFIKKTILGFVLMSGLVSAPLFAMAETSDEQEVTYAQAIVDNKEVIAVAAVATVIFGYVGYKYSGSVIDFVESLFVRSRNGEALDKIAKDQERITKKVATKVTSYYSNTYAQ